MGGFTNVRPLQGQEGGFTNVRSLGGGDQPGGLSPSQQQTAERTGTATLGGIGFEDVSTEQAPGALGAVQEVGANVMIGAGKEALRTITGIPEMISPGSTGAAGELARAPHEGLAQKVGALAEEAGEFTIGLKGVKTLAKLAEHAPEVLALMERYPKAARLLLNMTETGAVGGAQAAVKAPGRGEEPLKAAAAGAAGGAAGGAVAGGVELAAESKLARAFINRSLGASARDVTYGNPAKGMLDENLTAMRTGDIEQYKSVLRAGGTPEEAAAAAGGRIAAVNGRLNELKPQLDAVLEDSPARISFRDVVDKTITGARRDVINNPAMTEAEKNAAEVKLKGLYDAIREQHGTSKLTVQQANDLKNAIGDRISWGGTAAVGDEVKPVYRELYGALKEAVHRAVPEAGPLDERLTNLMAAWKDLVPLARKEEVGAGTGVTAGFVWDVLRRFEAEVGRVLPAVKVAAGSAAGQVAAGVTGEEAGRELLPKLETGYARFTASDGSVHDIPQEHLDKARAIDPGLKVHQ